jgi:hypothetical protein
LRNLGAPEELAVAAQRAYLQHRPADAIPGVAAGGWVCWASPRRGGGRAPPPRGSR